MMPRRKTLVLCYWSSQEVLTASAALPHARMLANLIGNDNVVFVTLEFSGTSVKPLQEKFRHFPVYVKDLKINLLTKAHSFITIPSDLEGVIKAQGISCILAIGTLAGSLAYLLYSRLSLPFYVDFYEPHAAYMLDNKVWSRFDPRYIFQKKWEWQQVKCAEGLMLVSEQFKMQLLNSGKVEEAKLRVVRNVVDADMFSFSLSGRNQTREQLGVPRQSKVGVYVGKFGDLYYREEAFEIYKKCFEQIEGFRLIILTPQSKEEILQQLAEYQLDLGKVYVSSAQHHEVPAYLSAADFAFATYKPGPSKKALSPVKVGEYWANGLPVLLTEGIGDDSEIIRQEGGGVLLNLEQEGSVEKAILQILEILQDPQHRKEIPKLAHKYRSPERLREAFKYFFGAHEQEDEV